MKILGHGEKVAINLGEKDGVEKGDIVLIYAIGEEIVDEETGRSYGYLELVRGKGKVIHTQREISVIESTTYSKPERKIVKTRNPLMMDFTTEEEIYSGDREIIPFEDVREGDKVKFL